MYYTHTYMTMSIARRAVQGLNRHHGGGILEVVHEAEPPAGAVLRDYAIV